LWREAEVVRERKILEVKVMAQTVHEFINSYEGFNYAEGEVVVFNQRTGKRGIFNTIRPTATGPRELHTTALHPNFYKDEIADRVVWDWTHTFKTMLITL
jgi:hypothetical protein